MKHRVKTFVAAAGLAILGLAPRGVADTITLSDLSQDPAAGVYKYNVTLDAAADVQPDDGFVLYDFGPIINFSFSNPAFDGFEQVETLTSNTLNDRAEVDDAASFAALVSGTPFDNPNIENLNFAFNGNAPLLGAHSAVLTITTVAGAGSSAGVFASIDHGAQTDFADFTSNGGLTQGFNISVNADSITVPNASLEFATAVPEINGSGLAGLMILMIGIFGLREAGIAKKQS